MSHAKGHHTEDLPEVLADVYASIRDIYGAQLQDVMLFGSYARGEAHADSDVDLLIVLNGNVDPLTEARRTSRIATNAAAYHDTALSFVHMSDDSFSDGQHPLAQQVRIEGISLERLFGQTADVR